MSDITERLKDSLSAGYSELRKEAADEITRLRADLDAANERIAEQKHAFENYRRQDEETIQLQRERIARQAEALEACGKALKSVEKTLEGLRQ